MRDCVIVGGGPAGLSAALVLGRARRDAVLYDSGTPRNAAAHEMRGFVGHDGVAPSEFRKTAREQLAAYRTVEVRDGWIDTIEPAGLGFRVAGEMTRRVILCTGLVDELPEIEGYRELWGKAIFQCPYCHAYEIADRRFAFWAAKASDLDHAFLLRAWTRDLVALTGGAFEVSEAMRQRFEQAQIPLDDRKILRMRRDGDRLAGIEVDGGVIACDALFAHPTQTQTQLVKKLKLALDEAGNVKLDEHLETSMPGVHAAGDLACSIHSAVVAAADGAKAAYMVNLAVTLERLAQRDL